MIPRRRADRDIISQAELEKGAQFMSGSTSATRLVSELYMYALERRLAGGARVEPGPLSIPGRDGCGRKDAGSETRPEASQRRRA